MSAEQFVETGLVSKHVQIRVGLDMREIGIAQVDRLRQCGDRLTDLSGHRQTTGQVITGYMILREPLRQLAVQPKSLWIVTTPRKKFGQPNLI